MLFSSVLQLLVEQLQLNDSLISVLHALISLIDVCSPDEYVTHVKPIMDRLYSSPLPIQVCKITYMYLH